MDSAGNPANFNVNVDGVPINVLSATLDGSGKNIILTLFTNKPVLILKVAWGAKSLHSDFRPPSAVAARGGEVGPYYTGLVDYVRDVLGSLGTEFPEFAGMGYRIAGMGWHQGWNDRVDATPPPPTN